ncbi:MAG: prevent-host-death protein [Acidobacteria bacterium RIFCSPLOWO2_02_FULL_65_29]|nr:MAG: prevent-host-death protein [Acidobacteria bacterium RIFCSPLOWO2_02_FULL_65_29]
MTNMAIRSRTARYVNIAEAKARLSELVGRAAVGEEVVIAKDHKLVAKLVPLRAARTPRKPGSAKGQIWIAPDFDAIPRDFSKYVK